MEKISALLGTLISFALILSGMGSLGQFFDGPSVMIVLGGTIGSTLIVAGVSGIKVAIKTTKVAFTKTDADKVKELVRVYKLSTKARKKNILALEEDCQSIEDDFLKKGLQLVIDGMAPSIVKDILNKEIQNTYQRHSYGQDVLNFISEAAPAFGMIGTLVGLVGMLANMDPETIGPNMSKALLTTFYGAVIANVIFIPLARKLEKKTEEEILLKEAILEGLLSMQASEAPSTTEAKLLTYLSPKMKEMFTELVESNDE